MSTTTEPEQVLTQLQSIDDYDFEHLVADLWARQGWDTEVSQASVDAGIDVIATKESPYPQKKLIQAKRYGSNTTVGGPDIQQYASLKHQRDNVDSVVVVTSNKFTRHAEDRAQELNVKTVDGDGLVKLVDQFNGYDLLEKYDTSDAISDTTSGAAYETVSDTKTGSNFSTIIEKVPTTNRYTMGYCRAFPQIYSSELYKLEQQSFLFFS